MKNIEDLRIKLHQSIEQFQRSIDEIIDAEIAAGFQQNKEGALTIVPGKDQDAYEYHYPRGTVWFTSGKWYTVTGEYGRLKMLISKTTVNVRGADRPAFFIYGKVKDVEEPKSTFACTEFTQTDTGEFSSVIPNPANPHAAIKAGESLPARLTNANVSRTDSLYNSVKQGNSLRLVVKENDTEGVMERAMLEHGYWVAHLRGHI